MKINKKLLARAWMGGIVVALLALAVLIIFDTMGWWGLLGAAAAIAFIAITNWAADNLD